MPKREGSRRARHTSDVGTRVGQQNEHEIEAGPPVRLDVSNLPQDVANRFKIADSHQLEEEQLERSKQYSSNNDQQTVSRFNSSLPKTDSTIVNNEPGKT